MLPVEVMRQAQAEFTDFTCGISALEISHRHKSFLSLMDELNLNHQELLKIPKNYRVLWTTGGATAQFSFVPLNLLGEGFNLVKNEQPVADYLCTGYWSLRAMHAASKYIKTHCVVDNNESHYCSVKKSSDWNFSKKPLYIFHTPNETISGLKFDIFAGLQAHDYNNAPIVADMTSCILSEPLDIERYGIIFASAQKNLGPTGITLVIIKEDLLYVNDHLPDIFSYKKLAETNSLLNTPPTFNLYIINLVLKWIKDKGGLLSIQQENQRKALLLYDFLDQSNFYINKISPEFRSMMNVTFDFHEQTLAFYNKKYKDINILYDEFIKAAEDHGLYNLIGHRSAGAFRASIYNSMPREGIEKLIKFLEAFASKYNF